MHQLENEKQSVRLHRRQVLPICDHDFCNAYLARSAQRLVQERVRFFAAFLRFEEIRLVEEFRIHPLKVDKVRDVDRVRGFDPHFFEILVAQDHIAPALVLETFYNLIGRHFFHVGLGDLLVFDRAEIGLAQLPKTELFFAGRRINGDRNINEAEADAAFPSWTHNQSPLLVRPGAGLSISANCEQLSITSTFDESGARSVPRASGCFAFYFSRCLVFTHAEENRLSQFLIAGPLGEFDFGDKLGIHPVHFFHHRRCNSLHPLAALFGWKIDKRTVVPLFPAKFLVQHRQRLLGEPASDFAGEPQFSYFVIANQNRAEIFSGSSWRRVTADYKFLLIYAFQFDPRPTPPPRFINGVALLAD